MRGLAPTFVRQSDDGDLLDGRMTQQDPLDFDRRDILSAADYHIFQTIANFYVAVPVNDRSVAGVKPTITHGLRRGLRVVVVTTHHNIAAHHDFTDRCTVAGNLAALIIHHRCLTGS